MAQIKKRGESYQIIVFLGRDSNQKAIFERTTYKPTAKTPKAIEKEVKAFADDFERRVKDGENFSGDRITFSQFVETWKENFLCQKSERAQVEYYKEIEKRFLPSLGHIKLSKIKAQHIDAVINDMKKAGYAAKTIRYTFTAINSVMKYAYKKGMIDENPCDRCDDLPKVVHDNELHYFTVDQAKRFLAALDLQYEEQNKAHKRHLQDGKTIDISAYTELHSIPFQYKIFFYIAIFGGFRKSEILALTWDDINYEKHSISINKAIAKGLQGEIVKDPKTAAGVREITLPAECFELLRQWEKEQRELSLKLGTAWTAYRGNDFGKNFIFIDMTSGRRMCLDTPYHKFKEIIQSYNSQKARSEEEKLPDIRLHDLRHTSATLLLANNTDIETVSKRLGHSKASVTLDVYGHAMKEMDEKAAKTLEHLFA